MSNNSPAFLGNGGFQTQQTFDTIKKLSNTVISKHDFTGSVRIDMDVRIFNALIGIEKDENNIEIITENYYDNSANELNIEKAPTNGVIELTAENFLAGINNVKTVDSAQSNIIDVGKYSDFYRSFANYVTSYFGLPDSISTETSQGVATLYSGEYNFLPNGGIFDSLALLNMFNGDDVLLATGSQNKKLTGTIQLNGITVALRNAVDTNCFGNRNRTFNDNQTENTASNDGLGQTSSTNYGVSDGFYDGDVIFVNGDGILLGMELGIDPVFEGQLSNRVSVLRSIGNSVAITLRTHSKCYLGSISQSTTSDTINFSFTGVYQKIIYGSSLVSGDPFTDYGTIESAATSLQVTNMSGNTLYFYSFTPVDSDGYKGITKIVEVRTDS